MSCPALQAAIGKGFAIGSATLVGLALFGAFVKRAALTSTTTSILSPMVFACLLLGAMVPYWFTARRHMYKPFRIKEI